MSKAEEVVYELLKNVGTIREIPSVMARVVVEELRKAGCLKGGEEDGAIEIERE